jgi:DNA helicase-2/ATP-dependent DNA helicase PcrA
MREYRSHLGPAAEPAAQPAEVAGPAEPARPGADAAGDAGRDGQLPSRTRPLGEGSLADLVESLIKTSGLLEYHRSQDEVAGTQKASNLDELVNASSLYPRSPEGLAEFLETIELDRSMSSDSQDLDAVTLITMHNTKGLEFPLVVVTGLEQGLFPRDDDEEDELEEQRRLFYVAITRAKDELHLTACRYRRLHGRLFETLPSRFISELAPEKLLFAETRRQGGSSQGGGQAGFGSRYGTAGARPGQAKPDGPVWRAGQAVYHEDYGEGVIIQVKPTPNSGALVVVRFQTGKQAQFFPKFSTKLEIQKG